MFAVKCMERVEDKIYFRFAFHQVACPLQNITAYLKNSVSSKVPYLSLTFSPNHCHV
uniref:Uncharacterized protein n=1 Tax=Arion vulgaris TaxID=1028688 RepID=A0A0B6ZVN4_9EUPU